MYKKITTQLHKLLFPSYEKDFDKLLQDKVTYANEIISLKNSNKILAEVIKVEREEKSKEVPEHTLADLMRQDLGLITVDFTHQEKGVPKHYLDLPDTLDGRNKRKLYISQLFQISQMEVWPVLMQNLIDTQGNYMLRVGLTDMDIFAGRFQISGISLVRDEVQKGFEEYMEGSKPKDDFDPTDHSTEGIPYSDDQKDIEESN